MRLLVTGCGRSGTAWLRHCLSLAGLAVKGESGDEPFAGGHQAEVSWRLAPYTPWPDACTVHLVRNPLDVIRSRADRHRLERNFGPGAHLGRLARRWCPGMSHTDDVVEQMAWHWVQWNRLVVADRRVRLEDVDAETVTGLARIADPAARVDRLPPPANATEKPSEPIGWERVAHVPGLLAMAESYGYAPRG